MGLQIKPVCKYHRESRYIFYSLLLHIGILGVALFFYKPLKVEEKPKEIVMSLVDLSSVVPSDKAIPKIPTHKEPHETVKPLPKTVAIKPLNTTSRTTIKTVATIKPQKITAETPIIKTSQAQPRQEQAKKQMAKEESKVEPKEESIENSKAEKQKAVAQYKAYVQQKIESSKKYPRAASELGQTGTVKVRFRVLSDGSTTDVVIVSGSGYSRLDEPTKSLIRNMKFKTIPKEINDGFIDFVSLSIRYNQEN